MTQPSFLNWMLIAFASCIASYILVRLLINHARKSGLIDRPNERSSHKVPTPRGGGVGFVITFFIAAIGVELFAVQSTENRFNFVGWLIPSVAVAVLGFIDDRFSLRASRRLAVQSAAAIASLVVIFAGGSPALLFLIFSFFFIVWLTNLYNFMDGIDGYAALEAILVSVAMMGILLFKGLEVPALLLLCFAGAITGFLILNWAPAKIFMGDAGSTFIGFFFGIMAIALHNYGVPIEVSIILLGTFIVDATYTLFTRALRGQKVYQAHRDHAYQHAVQRGWSHRKTVLFFSALTVFWLAPIAIFTANTHEMVLRFALLLLAYSPLIFLQIYFHAGIESAAITKAQT